MEMHKCQNAGIEGKKYEAQIVQEGKKYMLEIIAKLYKNIL